MKPPTGARSGTGGWLLQRATALTLALALPALTILLLAMLPFDFAAWRGLFAAAWLRVAVLLTAIALALHAWIGMRDILMDYVRPTGPRLALGLAVVVVLAGSVAWLMTLLWDLS